MGDLYSPPTTAARHTEAFADLFGTSTEFFFQNEGSGPLMGDYLMGEDIPEFTSRSLVSPTSYFVDTTRTARYPDHYSRRLRFAVLILEDNLYTIYPLAFDGTRFLELRGTELWRSALELYNSQSCLLFGRRRWPERHFWHQR